MKKILTLCIPIRGDRVLLGMKKRGFGVGRWNGFGGKVEEGETIEEGARREVEEESGIKDGKMERVGIMDFSFQEDEKILEVHIFKLTDFEYKLVETEEMRPEWFDINQIPYDQMWSDDKYWFPVFLENKLFRGKFHFDEPSNSEYSAKILKQELCEVPTLDSD
jgi:8-oxo-dGTP diphosphatase/2-hydroxy-dATP diphosphatase